MPDVSATSLSMSRGTPPPHPTSRHPNSPQPVKPHTPDSTATTLKAETTPVPEWQVCRTCGELAGAIFDDDDRLAGWSCDECRSAWTDPTFPPIFASFAAFFDDLES